MMYTRLQAMCDQNHNDLTTYYYSLLTTHYLLPQAMCEQNQWPTLRLDGQTPVKDRLGLVEQFNAPRPARDSGQQPWIFLLSSKVRSE